MLKPRGIDAATIDDSFVKPIVGALWVVLMFSLLDSLPIKLKRLVLLGLVIGGTIYLDRRRHGDS